MSRKNGTRSEVAKRWQERLARWQRSGLSIREFCRREHVSQPSFFQWRRRLASEGPSNDQPRLAPAFLPLEVVGNHGRSVVATESLDNGWMQITLGAVELRVPVTIDESALRQLVRVVREETGAC